MMKLSDREWNSFRISDFFNCHTGKYYSKNKYSHGYTPLVTAKSQYNGISDWINIKDEGYFENAITIGKVDASSFYQPFRFVCSSDVNVIKPKEVKLNKYIAIFLCNQIMMQKSKFDYGNQIRLNDTKALKIILPSINNSPDFQFMEDYIKERYFNLKSLIKKKQKHNITDLRELDQVNWGDYYLKDLFKFKRGNQNKMSDLIQGSFPLISAKKIRNGYKNFVEKNNKPLYPGSIISLNNDGEGGVGIAYYQPFKSMLDTHVTALFSNDDVNKYTLLFISRMITKQRNKFSHGYAISTKRLKRQIIKLPTKNNKPDYEFMEQYMKRKENEVLDRI